MLYQILLARRIRDVKPVLTTLLLILVLNRISCNLASECCLISSEPFEYPIVEIGKPEETMRKGSRRVEVVTAQI